MSTELGRLAVHLQRPLRESDRERARLHLLDWLACVAGARRSEVAEAGRRLDDPRAAAALLGNVLEMDDVHRTGRLHPGPVIWPAVLRIAETSEAMLGGAVAGYEAMIAVGASFDDHHYARWHPTASAGLIGAAAAASRVLGLGAGRTADALGHAASVAGGLWHMRHGANMTKQVHVLHAAESGVQMARLAAAGLTGARGTLEGPQGLWASTCAGPGLVQLGDEWRMHEVSFKPWAACRHAHPAIDAALELRSHSPFAPSEVAFLIETYADALIFCDRPNPTTPAEARFSLQHSVAVVLTHGDARPEHFELPTIAALAPLRDKVRVAEDPAFTARYPAHFGARVTGGGRSVERVDTLGDPERPLTPEQHRGKLEVLSAWGGLTNGADQAAQAVDAGPAAVRALLAEWLG